LAETARQRAGVIESPAVTIARAGRLVIALAKIIVENVASTAATDGTRFKFHLPLQVLCALDKQFTRPAGVFSDTIDQVSATEDHLAESNAALSSFERCR